MTPEDGMSNKYYFSYGMNANTNEMHTRCPNAKLLGIACLEGFKLAFHCHATIERVEDSVVIGTVWLITSQCEQSLDMLEGYPKYYDKIDVEVDQRGQTATAMAYKMNDNFVGNEQPTTQYFKVLAEGYADNGLPLAQLKDAADTVGFDHSKCISKSFLDFVFDQE